MILLHLRITQCASEQVLLGLSLLDPTEEVGCHLSAVLMQMYMALIFFNPADLQIKISFALSQSLTGNRFVGFFSF